MLCGHLVLFLIFVVVAGECLFWLAEGRVGGCLARIGSLGAVKSCSMLGLRWFVALVGGCYKSGLWLPDQKSGCRVGIPRVFVVRWRC